MSDDYNQRAMAGYGDAHDAAQQQALAQHQLETQLIIKQGREEHGEDRFDDMSAKLAAKLGDRVPEFMNIARQFDNPVAIVAALAEDEKRAEHLAKLPTHRMIAELGRLDAKLTPSSQALTSGEALWKSKGRSQGKLSDADWSSPRQDTLSEKEWDKQFWQRQKARAEHRKARGY